MALFSKERFITLLFIAAPLLSIVYGTLDYFGVIDNVFGIENSREALTRLQSVNGYPESFIYNDIQDKETFEILYQLIESNCTNQDFVQRVNQGEKPSLICVVGDRQQITGLPDFWPNENRLYYSQNHPVLVLYDYPREEATAGKGPEFTEVIGTIGNMEKWIDEKKTRIRYIVGVIVISIISICLILVRLRMIKNKNRMQHSA